MGRSPLLVPVVVLALEAVTATDWANVDDEPVALVAIALLVASASLPLCWRRRAAVAAFVAVMAAVGVAAAAYFATWAGAATYLPFLPPLVALYNVSARVRTRELVLALVVASGATAAHVGVKVAQGAFGWPSAEALSFGAFFELLLALCAYGGHRARTHRDEIDELEAERAAVVRDERDHLARELHDIVSHAVSIIVLQAAGARTVLTSDPDRADDALRSIEASGRQAMGELRRLLTVLRDDAGASADPVVAGATGTGRATGDPSGFGGAVGHRRLGHIDELVARVRDTGTPVTVTVHGQPSVLDPSVEHAAYRVVQEALTNACRYADDDGAEVSIDWRDGLVIDVRNERAEQSVAAVRDLGAGFGLVGLRERVAVIGGELSTSDDDGQHALHVRLPTPSSDRDPAGLGAAAAAVGMTATVGAS